MSKPLILVTNDDGIDSRGIRHLVEIMNHFGEVVIVAPDSPQSGMGHAITVGDKLRLVKSDLFDNDLSYKCSGTPADCVKIAKHHLLKERNIDLIVSGINHGSNSSISVLYSGTMSLKPFSFDVISTLSKIKLEDDIINNILFQKKISKKFLLCDYDPNASLSHTGPFIKKIVQNALQNGIPDSIALNVNIPAVSNENIKGIKVCKQANAIWEEKFDKRYDPYGREYFWMVGNFVNHDNDPDNDESAINRIYVCIVHCKFDLSSKKGQVYLNKNWKI